MKRKAVLERIASLERAIVKAKEYLESGKHAHWAGFRPLFVEKVKDGEVQPPHLDWVKNVFLRDVERLMRRAKNKLERLDEKSHGHGAGNRIEYVGRDTWED